MKHLIRKIYASIRDLNILLKISLLSILLMAVALVLSTTLLFRVSVIPSLEKDELLSKESFTALNDNLRTKYILVYNQTNLLHSSNHIANRLSKCTREFHQTMPYEDSRFISDYFNSVLFSDPDILDIVILSTDGNHCFARSNSAGRNVSLGYDFISIPAIQDFSNSGNYIALHYDENPPYVRNETGPVVTFIAKIYDPVVIQDKKTIGIMLINYPLSMFEESVQHYGTLDSSNLYILNAEDTVVYSNNTSAIGKPYDPNWSTIGEATVVPIGISKIRSIQVLADDFVRQASTRMVLRMIMVIFPVFCLLVFCILFFNRMYYRKISNLADAMENVSTDSLDIRLPVNSKDELGRLTQQFNEMCEHLSSYINMHYRSELRRQSAELNALQAQINPHFLFNTIESIRMRAVEDGAYDVASMLTQMGNMFRWMISMEKRIVYLEDEIEYLSAYLDLQSLRYGDSFDYDISVPQEALYLGIPKFTLQPIVENAIVHGLKENGRQGHIQISITLQDNNMLLSVIDNGDGINPEMLKKIQRHIHKEDENSEGFGIGLQNVQARIKLMFGEAHVMQILSQPHSGTEVHLSIPAMPKKEMEHYVSDHSS